MSEALDDVFGWELLQLGLWGSRDRLLAGCRTRRHAIAMQSCKSDGPGRFADADVVARLSQLPTPTVPWMRSFSRTARIRNRPNAWCASGSRAAVKSFIALGFVRPSVGFPQPRHSRAIHHACGAAGSGRVADCLEPWATTSRSPALSIHASLCSRAPFARRALPPAARGWIKPGRPARISSRLASALHMSPSGGLRERAHRSGRSSNRARQSDYGPMSSRSTRTAPVAAIRDPRLGRAALTGGHERELCVGEPQTTNNRMNSRGDPALKRQLRYRAGSTRIRSTFGRASSIDAELEARLENCRSQARKNQICGKRLTHCEGLRFGMSR